MMPEEKNEKKTKVKWGKVVGEGERFLCDSKSDNI